MPLERVLRLSLPLLFLLSFEKYVRIPFATAFAAAFVFGFLAHIWTRYSGFPSNTDLIIAGCVMPFVPGIAMTNAVRDLMNYHLNSEMSKLFETLLIYSCPWCRNNRRSCPYEIES